LKETVNFIYNNDYMGCKDTVDKKIEITGLNEESLNFLITSFYNFLVNLGYNEDQLFQYILLPSERDEIESEINHFKENYETMNRESEFNIDDNETDNIVNDLLKNSENLDIFKKKINENSELAKKIFEIYLNYLKN
jgi:hypothetical protein